MNLELSILDETLAELTRRLLEARDAGGHWRGELSPSALATATAVAALAVADRSAHPELIRRGLEWLVRNQNQDGGWGDSVLSKSNLSTTLLCWSALAFGGEGDPSCARSVGWAEDWLRDEAGSLEPRRIVAALERRYGRDRSFSAPILTLCALAGRLGRGKHPWRWIKPLPFELAALPHRWLKHLRLPVVSYALPALIAVGLARFRHRPPRNPFSWLLRRLAAEPALRVLGRSQPPSGGFLEATPLTAFVVMSLAASGQTGHPVVGKGIRFLVNSVREDGSWPIDTDLATWVTTLSVSALAGRGDCGAGIPASPWSPAGGPADLAAQDCRRILDWLLRQQHRVEHPYTHAQPGGWAWTDLSGGAPDADDTAGAMLALRNLAAAPPQAGNLHDKGPADFQREISAAALAGVQWLLDLQNRDGGIPTFCRGWGKLPFDRSSPDLTAHALAAWGAWLEDLPASLKADVLRAMDGALEYLRRVQRTDGSWAPLWFGSQYAPGEENPTYGTARVLAALLRIEPDLAHRGRISGMAAKAAGWLLSAQNGDRGWGGARGIASSVEETAVATHALTGLLEGLPRGHTEDAMEVPSRSAIEEAVAGGVSWLIEKTRHGKSTPAAPIGLYFARLWYFERLYPLIFAVAALRAVRARIK